MMTQAKPSLLRGIRRAALAGVVGIAVTLPLPAQASEVRFTRSEVSLSARGQNVRDFVADLFKAGGVDAKVSPQVKGKVQGVFRGNPKEVWTTISNAYGLVAYYDGGVVRVYSNQEVTTRSIPTSEAGQVVSQVSRLGLTDNVNKARASEGLVLATGVPAFLDRVQGMAGQIQSQAQRAEMAAPVVKPVEVAAANTGVVSNFASPLTKTTVRQNVRSDVIRAAGKRNPFEVRIFYLKYRDAADKEVKSAGQRSIIPGIATILNEQMGDGRNVGSVSTAGSHRYRDGSLLGDRNRGYSDRYRDDDDEGQERFEPDLNGPRISADSSVNAIIVRDRPETMEVYEQLIANLDIEPLMIETQVTILELNMSRLKELNLDFGFSLDSLAMLFGGAPALAGGSNIGAGYVSGGGDVFLARVRALEERGAMRVVSRPVLTSANNQPATFGLDTNQPIRLVGEREVDAFEVQSGMIMRIRPSAIEDGGDMRIRLDIEVSDKQYNGMVVDGIPGTSGPTITTQTVVRHGESAMLAGITRTATFDSKSKTPILGDIPLLGEIFKSRRKGEDHVERLFLLTPRISNLGSAGGSYAANTVQTLTLEQLQGKEPVNCRQ